MSAPTRAGDVVLLRVDSTPNTYAVVRVRNDGDQGGLDLRVVGHANAVAEAHRLVRPGGTIWAIDGPDSWIRVG
jgi:hypothetical protein